jgi:cobaltochelatase CobS
MATASEEIPQGPGGLPDMKISVRQVFGIDSDLEVPAYSEPDGTSRISTRTTCSTGRRRSQSSPAFPQPPGDGHRLPRHRQVDPHRAGRGAPQLAVRARQPRQPHQPHRPVGKDAIVIRDGLQVTEFRDGILPWALQHNIALCLRRIRRRPARRDVRHPARARQSGRLTLLDQNKVIRPHRGLSGCSRPQTPWGWATPPGLYHGTQQINQGQMDRWSIVTTLNYLPHDKEVDIVLAKARTTATRKAATSSRRWCASPTSPATPS